MAMHALEIYKQNRSDIKLVVTDIMMPGLDGMGLMCALRAGYRSFPSSPPAASAAASCTQHLLRGRAGGRNEGAGFKVFLAKPDNAENCRGSSTRSFSTSPKPVSAAARPARRLLLTGIYDGRATRATTSPGRTPASTAPPDEIDVDAISELARQNARRRPEVPKPTSSTP